MKIDLSNNTYGRLTVLPNSLTRIKYEKHWSCKCTCGNVKKIREQSLLNNLTKSCGCLLVTHGESSTSLYRRWQGMKNRCYLKSSISFKNYGGRGIKVQDSWINSFETFMNWAKENGYDPSLQLDRIDNNGDYTESNCRWVSRKINCRNKQIDNLTMIVDGEEDLICAFAERYGVDDTLVRNRINLGWDPKDALTIPSGVYKNYKKKFLMRIT
jgi:hypothetical protein